MHNLLILREIWKLTQSDPKFEIWPLTKSFLIKIVLTSIVNYFYETDDIYRYNNFMTKLILAKISISRFELTYQNWYIFKTINTLLDYFDRFANQFCIISSDPGWLTPTTSGGTRLAILVWVLFWWTLTKNLIRLEKLKLKTDFLKCLNSPKKHFSTINLYLFEKLWNGRARFSRLEILLFSKFLKRSGRCSIRLSKNLLGSQSNGPHS